MGKAESLPGFLAVSPLYPWVMTRAGALWERLPFFWAPSPGRGPRVYVRQEWGASFLLAFSADLCYAV